MDKKKIFPFKVKPDSYQKMAKILRFPGVTGPEMDDHICRVTVTDYPLDLSLKKEYIEAYKDDHLFQVCLLHYNNREFIVMASMLEHLDQPVILER